MAEENTRGLTGALSGWLKAGLTSVVGLLSGAVLMYLTPLVNNAIKPAKPVANFAAQVDGLNVNFNNRSTGATQGWWDFGDGSALEPFDPKAETVPHKYDGPGTYSVKLTLQNLVGDESDRTAPVKVDDNSTAAGPDISAFQLIPLTPGERAPAAYQLKSKVKAGTKCILSYGDDRPLEILDANGSIERLLYFPQQGAYTVRLAAFDGKQLVEQKQTVHVSANDAADAMAKLVVTYQAVRMERVERTYRIHCGWQPDIKDAMCPFRKERPADPGCTIVSVELVNRGEKNDAVRDAAVTISPDKGTLILSGELVKPSSLLPSNARPPHWLAEVKVMMERRSPPRTFNAGDVMVAVKPGSATLIPVQPRDPSVEILRRDMTLELWDGNRKAWAGNSAVTAAPVTLHDQPCLLTAAPQQEGFMLKIDTTGLAPAPLAPTPSLTPLTPPPAAFNPPAPLLPPPAPVVTPPPAVAPPPAPVGAPPAADVVPQYGPLRRTGYEYSPLAPLRAK